MAEVLPPDLFLTQQIQIHHLQYLTFNPDPHYLRYLRVQWYLLYQMVDQIQFLRYLLYLSHLLYL